MVKSLASQTTQTKVTPRWKILMALPESAKLWDISTGKTYTKGQFVPIYNTENSEKVDTFGIHASYNHAEGFFRETVHVPFLRHLDERFETAITAKADGGG